MPRLLRSAAGRDETWHDFFYSGWPVGETWHVFFFRPAARAAGFPKEMPNVEPSDKPHRASRRRGMIFFLAPAAWETWHDLFSSGWPSEETWHDLFSREE